MGLTLSDPERSNRVSGIVVLPSRLGRNEACHCGSGAKYKRCCREQDETLRRQQRADALPEWIENSRGKLHQFEKYAQNVFGLPDLLARLVDTRRAPKIPTFDVVNSLFHTALLRIPSLNALEGDLKRGDFQKLIGRTPTPEVKAFSADVVANVLDKLELKGIHNAIEEVIGQAERNKAFRDGYGPMRCVAVDGWEPFSSYQRHCPHCLIRKVKKKDADGEAEEVEQYYHRYVVALLLGPVIDVVLGIEPVRNEEALRDSDPEHVGHEGELTAGRRLIDFLYETYGGFIDAIVGDALYANGPVMTQLQGYGYGGFFVLKKENNEPFKEALKLWEIEGPCESYEDRDRKEQVQFWDVDEIETLETYKEKVRAIRAVVSKADQEKPSTWCFVIVGQRARQISRALALRIIRARWHIENTAFHQWTQYWHLAHVFRHGQNALSAVLFLWALAFNLLQLFIYRRLGRSRRPKDPTDTIRHLVEVMLREVATLPAPIPWATLLLNTS
jgi:SEC-C motif/Transposase DDE domain